MTFPRYPGHPQIERYVYDFAEDGGAISEIDLSAKALHHVLPVDFLVLDWAVWVETACAGATATVSIGLGADADGLAEVIPVADLSANAALRAGSYAGALIWDDLNDHLLAAHVADAAGGKVSITIATAALTAGKFHLFVFGIQAGAKI